jgi:hypothetical protein
MKRKVFMACVLTALGCSRVWAQDQKVEISGTAGWTLSDGVSGNSVTVPGVGTFNSVAPKDAFSWGVRLGYMATPNVEVGALFNQQSTKLEVGGTSTFDIGDMSVRNYHGYFAYNFGGAHASVRPYLLGGLGVTQYGSLGLTVAGVQHDIGGTSKFSTTWAAGLKAFPGHSVGLRLEARWTPTYIKSDAEGWFCDPFWGCYVVGNAQFSNQFDLSGGLVLRF